MNQEKYSLKWKTYSDHLKSMMQELMMNEDFSDVTLVTEDKMQIKANMNILSACSPVFKDILKKEKNSSQIMYLRGIQFSEMESIMQYIYLGEATFFEERMDEFLDVAKSLEIKGLCNIKADTSDEPNDEPPLCDQDISTNDVKEETLTSSSIQEQAQQERIRAVVGVNKKFECEQCHKTYSRREKLYLHKQSAHEGVKYACDQCDYKSTRQDILTSHIQSLHEGVKYPCDECVYQATTQGALNTHIKSKHEGFKYACDQCEYQSKWRSGLGKHIKNVHSDRVE